MSICACGAAAGYIHAVDCPYPMFFNSDSQWAKWTAARVLVRQQQAKDVQEASRDAQRS